MADRQDSGLRCDCDFYYRSSLTEMLGNNLASARGRVADVRPAKGTFPYVWVSHLVTRVEEGMRVVLVNENETENIAVCGDHPCGGKESGSYYSQCLNLFAAVGATVIVMENDFGLMGKNGRSLQGNVSGNVRDVAAFPCPCPFSRPYRSPRASSS